MFNSYEFVFDGVSSEMYNLQIYDLEDYSQSNVPFGNKASIIEAHTTGRIQNIHYGVDYHKEPLEFNLVFGAEEPLDRYELEEVALWLTGHQDYKWLEICQPDLTDVQFRCIITELTPVSISWAPYAFQATIRCDCPYAYGPEFSYTYTIKGKTNILFFNESTTRAYLRPTLTFYPAGSTTSLSIVNLDDNSREFKVENFTSSSILTVDNKNGIIYDAGSYNYNLYGGFNLNFFQLVQGDNNLVVNGDGELIFTLRYMYNVGV